MEIAETNENVIFIVNKKDFAGNLDEKVTARIVDLIAERFTNHAWDHAHHLKRKIQESIESALVEKATEEFVKNNYEKIVKSIDLKTVSRLTTAKAAQRVSQDFGS